MNRSIGNQQLGFLMAFLARKVLGQYDISLLAATPTARGRLHFVEPNIRATAANMRLPLDEFRTFIALHEATHAFEFEAYPWLRDALRRPGGRVDRPAGRRLRRAGRPPAQRAAPTAMAGTGWSA